MNIAPNNASVLHGLSPYNWYQNSASYIQTVNPGAYIKLGFTGTSISVTVDVSAMVTAGYAANIYPVIKWSIDGGAYTVHQLSSSDISISLFSGSTGSHTLVLYLIGVDESGASNRWDGTMSLKINGFTIDGGSNVFNATLNTNGYYLSYGDSVTEGAVVLGNSDTYARDEEATFGYQAILATGLNAEYGNCAFAGQGWVNTNINNVPGFTGTWNYIFEGIPRTFSPTPNLITINMGSNSTADAPTVSGMMKTIRAGVGPIPNITMIVPFTLSNEDAVTGGFYNYTTANTSDTNVFLINLLLTGYFIVAENTYGSPHPNATGHALLEALMFPMIYFPPTIYPLYKRLASHLKLYGIAAS